MLAQLEHLNACIYKSHMCKQPAVQNQIFLSQPQSYCHVHCNRQPGLSGLFLLAT